LRRWQGLCCIKESQKIERLELGLATRAPWPHSCGGLLSGGMRVFRTSGQLAIRRGDSLRESAFHQSKIRSDPTERHRPKMAWARNVARRSGRAGEGLDVKPAPDRGPFRRTFTAVSVQYGRVGQMALLPGILNGSDRDTAGRALLYLKLHSPA
jgi:hypothetical protein